MSLDRTGLLGQLASPSGPFAGWNMIINGDIRIDQRNSGGSINGNSLYCVDRFFAAGTVSNKYTVQKLATTPAPGFANYLAITSSSAYSVTSSDRFYIEQGIEGDNTAPLQWGTASAQYVTLSFWVRSSLTGTFGGSLSNVTPNRSYPFTYTINSANTWEKKSITIPGDTSGTWSTGSTAGIYVRFGLGMGSTYSGTANTWAGSDYRSATGAVSVVGTSGATFWLTGIQLESGQITTSFDYKDQATLLNQCWRFFYRRIYAVLEPVAVLTAYGASNVNGKMFDAPCPMRITPTVSLAGGFVTLSLTQGGNVAFTGMSVLASIYGNVWVSSSSMSAGITYSSGDATLLTGGGSTAVVNLDAEY